MILHVVGARPNYVKAAPVIRFLNNSGVKQLVVNTSQHYSDNMSKEIMRSVGMPDPDIVLPVLSFENDRNPSMMRFSFMLEQLCGVFLKNKPSCVIVYGDVDSTLAGALAAKKCGVKLAHVESGLRSFDDQMPEEINRRLVDEISDVCFVTEESGLNNLKHKKTGVKMVGNTMIDSLVWVSDKKGLRRDANTEYILLTFHRPSNVDNKSSLIEIIEMCESIKDKILCPLHPRTKQSLCKYNLYDRFKDIKNIEMLKPLPYVEFLKIVNNSFLVVTDSGGVQEETSYLGIPCFTIRNNTERPITITKGTNKLMSFKDVPDAIANMVREIKNINIPMWDGKASERLVKYLHDYLKQV